MIAVSTITRRAALACGASLLPLSDQTFGAEKLPPHLASKKKVAAIVTEYRHWSHADVIVGRLLGGYSAEGVWSESRSRVVSMYTDQVPEGRDMSRDLAARFGFKIYPSVSQALTQGGTDMAVDAVALVGEHGDYPTNDLGQKLYPRYELFSQIMDVLEHAGRPIPVFIDKHFSYSWEKAAEMYRRARQLRLPLMAGSSIPVTVRTPALEIPAGASLTHAVAVGYGDHDAYGFHTLECLQCMVERRAGGETGVKAVEWIPASQSLDWLNGRGAWAKPLLELALQAAPRKIAPLEQEAAGSVIFSVTYLDGLEAACLMQARGSHWTFATHINRRQPVATYFGSQKAARPLPHFDGLVRCIDEMFVTGREPWPVERTLLTTGILAFLFQSKKAGCKLETPALTLRYTPPERAYFQGA
jgi:hypothetical protein